ncbi:glycosyltransferase [Halobaculum roseum]|uniref:Glycosyltransferase n=1 Tax=Halobaculum roseum TaxID=2175149 RepID=A0ABD5MW26_9EURY|nr:glycosyltransferase [Halobaculum roseum]QZY04436.1 glycosyltransferase [Halobaculum roseum]
MYRGQTVGVVIPAYNEEPFVRETIVTVPAFVDRIYVVDDASTDDTWTEIQRAVALDRARSDRRGRSERNRKHDRHNSSDRQESRPERPDGARGTDESTRTDGPFDERIVAIRHEENRGVGGAIKTGYLHARDDDIAATAVMGGDGQMDPDVLGTLFDPIVDGEADYVKGNRFVGRRDRGDMPRLRFVGNAMLGALTKIASGYWSTGDPQSGYTAISRRALHEADIEGMYEFYGYCNDLLVKLNVARLRVVDLPNPIIYGDEESHIRYRTYVPRVSWMLLRNFLWRLRTNYLVYDFHPLVVAYGVGAGASALGAVGLFASLASVAGLVGAGSAAASTVGVAGLVSALLFVVGACALVGAMAMDISENDHLDDVLFPDRGGPTGGPVESGPDVLPSVAGDTESNGSQVSRKSGSTIESDGGRRTGPSDADSEAPPGSDG